MGTGPEARNGQLRGPDVHLVEFNGMVDWIGRACELRLEERDVLRNNLPADPGFRRKSSVLFRLVKAELDEATSTYLDETLRNMYVPPNIPLEQNILRALRDIKHESEMAELKEIVRDALHRERDKLFYPRSTPPR